MKNSILIVTGGTGGHVIPAVNFFNYIYKKSNNVFLITDKRGHKFTKNINKNNIIQINSSHLSGSFSFKLFAVIQLLIGFIQVWKFRILKKPKIKLIFLLKDLRQKKLLLKLSELVLEMVLILKTYQ